MAMQLYGRDSFSPGPNPGLPASKKKSPAAAWLDWISSPGATRPGQTDLAEPIWAATALAVKSTAGPDAKTHGARQYD